MNCYYHPDRSAVAQCVTCGKNLCSECIVTKEEQPYCRDCLKGEFDVEIREIVFPALICGVIGGFLSAAPVISILNCIFCMWIVIAGALAVYLVKSTNKIKGKIRTGKAALTGIITGFVASIVMWLASLAQIGGFSSILREAMMDPGYQQALRDAGAGADMVAALVIMILVVASFVLFAFFGALGGIISNEVIK
ncbi:MAG: hypothetical protein HXS48_00610 [Theionarchaea archaeon]|nr:MAG: hypothetical protein AYK19_03745 [Theionarchaea archaeon DG-70-1]MBU7025413.1 hypothetical protein [Theionarchaea archaeon]